MKSAQQMRGESLLEDFRTTIREPLVIEFSGSPKAGKTTVLNAVAAFLKRCGYKVDVVVERASVCPIRDKRHFHFNVWTACTSLTQLLERAQAVWKPDDPQVVILDRGIFDSVCWMRMMNKLSRLSDDHLQVVEQFLLLDEWRKRLAGVVVMTSAPVDSMEREKGHLPVVSASGQPVAGSIMNPQVLSLYSEIVRNATNSLKDRFNIHTLDTSTNPYLNDVKGTCEAVATFVLDRISERIEEQILHCPSESLLSGIDSENGWIDASGAAVLVSRFESTPTFRTRSDVEADTTVIQPIPVAIIRDGNGNVLRLKRREKDRNNSLNDATVVWAGGHCRIQDQGPSGPLLRCLVRELDEELRLQVRPEQFQLIGAVYTPSATTKGKQHLAIVYEWIAPSDDVAIVLNAEEFVERRGNSQSGRFASVSTIIDDIRNPTGRSRPKIESWTAAMLTNYLAPGTSLVPGGETPDMFSAV